MANVAAANLSEMEAFVRRNEVPLRSRPQSTLQLALHDQGFPARQAQILHLGRPHLKEVFRQRIAEDDSVAPGVIELATIREGGFASLSADGEICLWDSHAGSCMDILAGPVCRARFLCSNGDGNYLASADDQGEIYVWDVGYCKCIQQLSFRGSIESLTFSSEGSYICAAGTTVEDGTSMSRIAMWDTSNGRLVSTREMGRAGAVFVSLTQQGWFCANSSHIQEFDADGLVEEMAWDITTSGNHLSRMQLSPDASLIVSCHDEAAGSASAASQNYVKVWSRHTWQCLATIGVGLSIVNVEFSGDYICYATEEEVCVWSCSQKKHVICHSTLASGVLTSFCVEEGYLAYGAEISTTPPSSRGEDQGISSQIVFCELHLNS